MDGDSPNGGFQNSLGNFIAALNTITSGGPSVGTVAAALRNIGGVPGGSGEPPRSSASEPRLPEGVDPYDAGQENPEQSDFLCPVCWDTLKEPVITKCGHTFCFECLRLSLSNRKECPLDRTKLGETDFAHNKLAQAIIEHGDSAETVSRTVVTGGEVLTADPSADLVCQNHFGLFTNAHVDAVSGETLCMGDMCEPNHRVAGRRLFKNTFVQKRINSLGARCLNGWTPKNDGALGYLPMGHACQERFTVGHSTDHAKQCPAATVPCPHSTECGTMLRKHLKTHYETVCPHVKCPHPACDFAGNFAEWRNHMIDNAYAHAFEAAAAEMRRLQSTAGGGPTGPTARRNGLGNGHTPADYAAAAGTFFVAVSDRLTLLLGNVRIWLFLLLLSSITLMIIFSFGYVLGQLLSHSVAVGQPLELEALHSQVAALEKQIQMMAASAGSGPATSGGSGPGASSAAAAAAIELLDTSYVLDGEGGGLLYTWAFWYGNLIFQIVTLPLLPFRLILTYVMPLGPFFFVCFTLVAGMTCCAAVCACMQCCGYRINL